MSVINYDTTTDEYDYLTQKALVQSLHAKKSLKESMFGCDGYLIDLDEATVEGLCDFIISFNRPLIRGSTTILNMHSNWVWCLAMDTSTHTLFSGSPDRTIKVWQKKDGNMVCMSTLEGHKEGVSCLTYDSHSHILFSGSWDKTIRVWSKTQENNFMTCVSTIRLIDTVLSLAYDSKSQILYTVCGLKISVWRISAAWDITCISNLYHHTEEVIFLNYDNYDKKIISGCQNGKIKKWEYDKTNDNVSLVGESSITRSYFRQLKVMTYDSITDSLFTASGNNILLWQPPLNNHHHVVDLVLVSTLYGHTNQINCLLYDTISKSLFSGSRDHTIKVWRWKTREIRLNLDHTMMSIGMGNDNNNTNISEILTCIYTYNGHYDEVKCMVYDSMTQTLYSGSFDKTIKVWQEIEKD